MDASAAAEKAVGLLEQLLVNTGEPLAAVEKHRFERFTRCLLEQNRQLNLTGIVEPAEVAVKHHYDSLTALFYDEPERPQNGARVLDLGSGAGFPGIPLLIRRPDLHMTFLDSRMKRVQFIENVLPVLELQAEAVHMRAETAGHERGYREQYQRVYARAVAPLAVLVEFSLPLTVTGGRVLAMKGPNVGEELEAADKAIERLGGRVANRRSFVLPEGMGERTIVSLEKIKDTPEDFPRRPGTPERNPL